MPLSGPIRRAAYWDETLVKPIIVFGPLDHHPEQRILVFLPKHFRGVRQRGFFDPPAGHWLRRSDIAIQPGECGSDAVFAEYAISALRTVAGVVEDAVVGCKGDRVILAPSNHRADIIRPGLNGFDMPVLVAVVTPPVGPVAPQADG